MISLFITKKGKKGELENVGAGDFPDSPEVKSLRSQCRTLWPKKKKERKEERKKEKKM